MKLSKFICPGIVIISLHVFADQGLSESWKNKLKPLPADAQKVIEKYLRCKESGGDDVSLLPKESQRSFKKLKCETISDERMQKLAVKYSSNEEVLKLINCAQENSLASDDCP